MRATALQALADADVIVYVVDVGEGTPEPIETAAALDRPPAAPVLLALNKVDRLGDAERERLRTQHPHAVLLSATRGDGIPELLRAVTERLPLSPFLYPADDVSTQSLRFFVAELVRETALEQLAEEVPYSIACEVEEFREERRPVYIRAVIYVERESQKRILIGDKGSRIRDIGRAARVKVEELVGSPVYLDLWVKVLANWRKNERAMQRFGYRMPKEPRR
jgi:GTP-binding protein Era